MKHIFQKGSSPKLPTLLLLHGTGGTEYDLIAVAQRIAPDSNALSVRGEVRENGMARFFRRLAEGVFDEEDLLFHCKNALRGLRSRLAEVAALLASQESNSNGYL